MCASVDRRRFISRVANKIYQLLFYDLQQSLLYVYNTLAITSLSVFIVAYEIT